MSPAPDAAPDAAAALVPDPARHLHALRGDVARLREVALRTDPATPVPGCPGWGVEDVVRHVADVQLRQAAAVEAGHRVPPGHPAGAALPGEDALAHLDRAAARILAVVDRDPATPCWTWPEPRGRLRFWQRRMAQETLVHRVDVEQAAGEPTPVADDLALDGVDEVLTVFLPLALPAEGPAAGLGPGLRATVLVRTGPWSWPVEVVGTSARVRPAPVRGGAAARVTGAPDALLLWLWGRADDAALHVEGDTTHVVALRRALAAATR